MNTEIPVKSPRFALFDLAEGKSYSFRVRCCNSAGVGEPSDPTEATTVGDKLGQRIWFDVCAFTATAQYETLKGSGFWFGRYPVGSWQSRPHQEHRHLSSRVLGGVSGRQGVGGLLYRDQFGGQQ